VRIVAGGMKLLVLGAGGQVGQELRRARWPSGYTLVAFERSRLDITQRQAVIAAIEQERPDLVINAAAFTAVDRAESDADAAFAVNRDGPAHLAAACAVATVPLIHFSTDYVYDGTKPGPYREDDLINPLGIYGRSKADGDQAIRNGLDQHVILRTSWLYSVHGTNFVKSMLRLAVEQPHLRVVADQRGSPTSAADIAAALIILTGRIAAGTACWGTYNYTGAGATTWHGFAEQIFTLAAPWIRTPPTIEMITSADYSTPVRRPANSMLDCCLIQEAFGIELQPWRVSLAVTIRELFEREPRHLKLGRH
jgi:dTDP-4-dehydrorhamnose reductase